jgi:hypothetical protein
LAVTPPNKYLDGVGTGTVTLKKKSETGSFLSQHGDIAFAESQVSGSLFSCDAADAASKPACEASNKSMIAKYVSNETANTPNQVIAKWLTESCAGSTVP